MELLIPPRHVQTSFAIALMAVQACGGSDGSRLRVGAEGPEAGTAATSGVGGASGAAGIGRDNPADGGVVTGSASPLRVHVEDLGEMTIEVVTVACAGDCADVRAVASGGNPPYEYAWEDGSTSALRRVCLDASATLSVSATDTAIDSEEFSYGARTASTELTARVLGCEEPPDAGTCDDPDVTPIEELTPDIFGTPTFFSGGQALPVGRYRVAYVDGCMKYDASWSWTVQGTIEPVLGLSFQWVLVRATTNVLAMLPGTAAPISVSGYATYEECVAANLALPPLDIDFTGGPLAIWQNDFQPSDNIAGDRSPTWSLSRLTCP